ncbi:hypothetical protein YSA_08413 [Pseudomonas putida ND6]|uniref:Uncharacterized protein n=1 Tax=Pseudomonas putida ND6 TaxID=231023 RepID=I3V0P9_PSEPU|nr:hypothetical protein YSA_08413 [Pseudomonas putida ND6]
MTREDLSQESEQDCLVTVKLLPPDTSLEVPLYPRASQGSAPGDYLFTGE